MISGVRRQEIGVRWEASEKTNSKFSKTVISTGSMTVFGDLEFFLFGTFSLIFVTFLNSCRKIGIDIYTKTLIQ